MSRMIDAGSAAVPSQILDDLATDIDRPAPPSALSDPMAGTGGLRNASSSMSASETRVGHGASSLVAGSSDSTPPSLRASEMLRAILAENPDIKTFSVGRIVQTLGSQRIEAALLVCSVPGIVPIPTDRGMVPLSTGALACQLVAGTSRFRLPRFIQRKTVSRRALAVAIHAILPLLEAVEGVVRPRWSWVHHPYARRAIGVIIFLSALAIAEPLLGYNLMHATAVFVMSLGMAERDGLAVLIGVAVGVASLILVAASGVSVRIARSRAASLLRKVARNLGRRALAAFLESRGYKALARVVSLRVSDLLMLWDPEKSTVPATGPADPRRGTSRPRGAGRGNAALRSTPRASVLRGARAA